MDAIPWSDKFFRRYWFFRKLLWWPRIEIKFAGFFNEFKIIKSYNRTYNLDSNKVNDKWKEGGEAFAMQWYTDG